MLDEVCKPHVLTDRDIAMDIAPLDRAWEADATFALVPERAPVSREWIAGALDRLPEAWRRDHFALLTSGSTGQPRLVIGARQRAEDLARLLDRVQRSEQARETVLTLPLTYCYAFVNQWLWARVLGRALVTTSGMADAAALRGALDKVEQSTLCLVGAQVPMLAGILGSDCFPGISHVHFAGGAFPQHSITRLREWFPRAEIFNNYGCAEAMPRLSVRNARDSADAANIGTPLPGVELVADERDNLLFRSPYRAVGIVTDGEVGAFADEDWIATGDLGCAAEDGSWLVLGRAGEVFKRYGEKFSIPSLLQQVHEVWDGEAACYRASDRAGEPGAVLVLAPRPDADGLARVLRALRGSFPRPLWPLRIEAIPTLPRLSSGKPDTLSLTRIESPLVLWRQRI